MQEFLRKNWFDLSTLVKRKQKFLRKNWFNLSTLLISIVALLVAFQANFYSKEASEIAKRENEIIFDEANPKIEIYRNGKDNNGIVHVMGCQDLNDGDFELYRQTIDTFTFINKGGRSSSLVNATFSEADYDYQNVELYELGVNGFEDKVQLKLPLDIESGKGRIWMVKAFDTSHWESLEKAQQASNPSNAKESQSPEIPKPAVWHFEFSDGTVIAMEYKGGWYHVDPSIFKTNCK